MSDFSIGLQNELGISPQKILLLFKDEKWIDHIEVGKTWDKAPMII
jgi:hypothetical protein